jgi:hypothetical protein
MEKIIELNKENLGEQYIDPSTIEEVIRFDIFEDRIEITLKVKD